MITDNIEPSRQGHLCGSLQWSMRIQQSGVSMQEFMVVKESPAGRVACAGVYGSHENLPEVNNSELVRTERT